MSDEVNPYNFQDQYALPGAGRHDEPEPIELPAEPPPLPPVELRAAPPPSAARRLAIQIGVLALSLVIFLSTIGLPEASPAVAINYLSLATTLGLAGYLLAQALPERLRVQGWTAAVFLTCLLLLAWSHVDWFERTIVEDGVTTRDLYRRVDPRHSLYRWVSAPPVVLSGPIAGENKAHGHWTAFDPRRPAEERTQSVWFWYGEIVSEGEWHLRSK